MDFQGLAEHSHNIIAATLKKKIVARTSKWNFKFHAEDYFRRQYLLLLQLNLQKNSFS